MTDSQDLWVGIDLGTQSVKVSIVDGDGVSLAESRYPLDSVRDGDLHEQDPRQWVQAVEIALRRATGILPNRQRLRITGTATCSTSGTIAVLDREGAPTRAGLMYDDARAASVAEEVMAADPALWSSLGYRIQPSWAICKIVWLSRHGALGAGDRIVHQNDVVAEAMTGSPVATDWSSALKSGYDQSAEAWPTAALEALGVRPAALPSVVGPGVQIGEVSHEWAERTGLPAGTAVISGMTDGCASQLGAGALSVGDWHSVIGTTMVLKGVSPVIIRDDSGALYSHRAPHDGLWLPGGASSVGAGALQSLLPGRDLDVLDAEADAIPPRIPICYPLLGRGERFPFVRSDAEGYVVLGGKRRDLAALTGLPAVDMLRAIQIGIACVERLSFDMLEAKGAPTHGRLTTSGGGSRSATWTQLRASMLERAIVVPASAEASLGMAILAAWCVRKAESLQETSKRMTRTSLTVEPESAQSSALLEHYGRFTDSLVEQAWIGR